MGGGGTKSVGRALIGRLASRGIKYGAYEIVEYYSVLIQSFR